MPGMRLATHCSNEPPQTGATVCAQDLLPVRPTRRRYPLLEFLRASPLLRSDIAFNTPGVPLSLCLRLHDAGGRAIRHAAVYIWHHDAHGWTFDPRDDEIGAVTFMRGVQISDARGEVRFQTICPGRCEDQRAPVYLQVYFNDGDHVFARSDACLLLPDCRPALLADPEPPLPGLPQPRPRPAFRAPQDAALLPVPDLQGDPRTGGVMANIAIGIALGPRDLAH